MILKSGETLEVEVLEVTDKGYRVIHHFSKGIKDEKTIPKEDVLKIRKGSTLDDEEYKKLKGMLPVPDGKSVKYYNELLDEYFLPFLEEYPDSEFKEEVEKAIKELKEEKKQIAEGAVKYKGEFITSKEVQDSLFDFNAEKIREKVNQAFDDKKVLSGIREYENFRGGYLQSKAFLKTAKRINDMLIAMKDLLEKKIANPDKEPDEAFYKTLNINEANRIKAEFQKKRKSLADQIASDKENGEIWLTIDFSSPTNMQSTVSLIENRLKEIEEWSVTEKVDGGMLYSEIYSSLQDEDIEGAKFALEKFQEISPPEEMLADLTAQLENLELEIKAQEEEKLEAKETEQRAVETDETDPEDKAEPVEEKQISAEDIQ